MSIVNDKRLSSTDLVSLPGGGSSSPWNQLPRQALMRGVGNPWKTYGNVQGQQQQSQLMRNVGMRGMGRRGGMAVRGMGAGMGNAGGMFG